MPIFEYIKEDTGEQVEMVVPFDRRDSAAPGFRRLDVPSRICVSMHGRKGRQTPGVVEGFGKAFKEIEQQHGADYIEKGIGRSVKSIKKIWNDFKVNDQAPERRTEL